MLYLTSDAFPICAFFPLLFASIFGVADGGVLIVVPFGVIG